MIREFRLPDIGEGLTEAEIVSWMVAEGERVELDQPVVEIETDKALMEIPTPYAGTLLTQGAPEGTVLAVGSVLLTIETDDEEVGSPGAPRNGSDAAPIVGTLSSDAVDLTPRAQSSPEFTGSRPEVLPIVRKLARELDVDVASIVGTGADGKITRDDVRAAAQSDSSTPISPTEIPVEVDESHQSTAPVTEDTQRRSERAIEEPAVKVEADRQSAATSDLEGSLPLSKMRRTIAERMSKSWREIPHVTTFGSADVTRLMTSRTALKSRRGAPVSVDAMVVKAVATALEQHRELAARLTDDAMVVFPTTIDIGVAVDTKEGLTVVVVADPAALDLVALTAEIARLAAGARDRSLGADAFTGQSFTVSNIGAVGGGYGTPIIPHGTTAILSVGKAEDIPVAREGRLQIAPMMPLSLSYDHRLIDGAAGRRFLATIIENLEEPTLFLA